MHNKAAKFVLVCPNRDSSSKALVNLNWRSLFVRRKIQCCFGFRCSSQEENNNLKFPFKFKDTNANRTIHGAAQIIIYQLVKPTGETNDHIHINFFKEFKATLYPKFWRIVKELKEVFELEEF